jgi:uncharacterized protein (TIGR03435 family)
MLRSLLASRFRLSLHHETREMSVYELHRTDGLKLTKSKDETCTVVDVFDPPLRDQPLCHRIQFGPGLINAYGVDGVEFARSLFYVFGRPVVDKTGYSAMFDVHLEFTPDESIGNSFLKGTQEGPGPRPPAADESERPSIFTAMQEQLGLKLVSARDPIDVLVIDHVERPSEN